MDGLQRTGGNDNITAVSAVTQSRAQERLAEEAAKYRLPGMALGDATASSDGKPKPVPPVNLAQLRTWVAHETGIDLYA
ncbi:MAG: hypothetical protein QM679_06545 [Patulibacter sp.]